MELNEIIASLAEQNGITDIVKALAFFCARNKTRERESGALGSEVRADAWEADEKTFDKTAAMIVND